jgi:hypothetical protein
MTTRAKSPHPSSVTSVDGQARADRSSTRDSIKQPIEAYVNELLSKRGQADGLTTTTFDPATILIEPIDGAMSNEQSRSAFRRYQSYRHENKRADVRRASHDEQEPRATQTVRATCR